METIKFRGLRSSFILYVLTTLILVAILSGLTIWGCITLQKTLLPDSNQVYLTIQKSDSDGNETTTTFPMALNDVLKEIPSLISMEDTEDDIPSDDQTFKYAVTKIENSFSALSPKQKFIYQASQTGMIILPIIFFLWQEYFSAAFCFIERT